MLFLAKIFIEKFIKKLYDKIFCTYLLTGNHDWSIREAAKCKIKSCLAQCAISVTLPLSSRGARSVVSLMLNDVSK